MKLPEKSKILHKVAILLERTGPPFSPYNQYNLYYMLFVKYIADIVFVANTVDLFFGTVI